MENSSFTFPENDPFISFLLSIKNKGFTEKALHLTTEMSLSVRHHINNHWFAQEIQRNIRPFLPEICSYFLKHQKPERESEIVLCGRSRFLEIWENKRQSQVKEEERPSIWNEKGWEEVHWNGKIAQRSGYLGEEQELWTRPEDWSFSGLVLKEFTKEQKKSKYCIRESLPNADQRLLKLWEEEETEEIFEEIKRDLKRKGTPITKTSTFLSLKMSLEYLGP